MNGWTANLMPEAKRRWTCGQALNQMRQFANAQSPLTPAIRNAVSRRPGGCSQPGRESHSSWHI